MTCGCNKGQQGGGKSYRHRHTRSCKRSQSGGAWPFDGWGSTSPSEKQNQLKPSQNTTSSQQSGYHNTPYPLQPQPESGYHNTSYPPRSPQPQPSYFSSQSSYPSQPQPQSTQPPQSWMGGRRGRKSRRVKKSRRSNKSRKYRR